MTSITQILDIKECPHYQGPGTPAHKTTRWMISCGGTHLGEIRWFGRWRKYCFFPEDDTVFDENCLREIAKWGEEATKKHRDNLKARKSHEAETQT